MSPSNEYKTNGQLVIIGKSQLPIQISEHTFCLCQLKISYEQIKSAASKIDTYNSGT